MGGLVNAAAGQVGLGATWPCESMVPLHPQWNPAHGQTVAHFYRRVMDLLNGIGVAVAINEMPNEVENPLRFPMNQVHGSYDADAAHAFWRVLVQADRIFKIFRSGFIGKASPVHFFWGSFDLAVTRFSGRRPRSIGAGYPVCLMR